MRTVTLTIDGKACTIDVGEGRNLLDACLSLGFDLPYFCWHPAMHSVGACRQCAVKLFRDEKDQKGRIVMACMTAAADGMRLSIDDPEARAFRAGIIEWLMVNHPHDCPICDEGGECHLQDMTVMAGHVYRGYRFTKRTHRNQYLGPFLNHEMNRCIQCYRCLRFYRDYAGGRDFHVLGWHDNVYFGRHEDGILESEFSGNLVEVCPTGVFTDKTFKDHYARKWDLHTAPSVCAHCGVGCNTTPGERYGMLRRVRPRYNGEVNGYFLCDRGRYGYEFVNAESRIRAPTLGPAGHETVSREKALQSVALALSGKKAIGIGSSRASLETNFALRQLVGPQNFFLSVPDSELRLLHLMLDILRGMPVRSASTHDAAQADAVLILGEDVGNTAPILALNLRQASRNATSAAAMRGKNIQPWDDAALREAVQDARGPFFVATPEPTSLDLVASETFRGASEDIARLGFAVAHIIDGAAPAVPDLTERTLDLARRIAEAMSRAERPLIVSGPSLGSAAVIHAAANIAQALNTAQRTAHASFVFPDANSFGAALMADRGLDSAVNALRRGGAETVVVAETDLFRQAGPDSARSILGSAFHLISVDHTANATTRAAEIVLPASTFAESSGTMVNSEGRAQRFFAVFKSEHPIQESWRWIGEISSTVGRRDTGWRRLDEIIIAIEAEFPRLTGIGQAAPAADFRMNGQRVPRGSHRESGRTSITAHLDVHERKPPEDVDSPLAHSMEGRQLEPPASLFTRFWSPGWNSDQAVNKFQNEMNGPLHGGDPGIRLIEPPAISSIGYFTEIPASFTAREGMMRLIAHHHVFGSEELSAQSRGIAELTPKPYIALGSGDAARLGLHDGDETEIRTEEEGSAFTLRVVIRDLPPGIAAIPHGVPGTPYFTLPAWGRVTPAVRTGGTEGAATGMDAGGGH
jgi:NADH-quinone oxidoreductase subunit G